MRPSLLKGQASSWLLRGRAFSPYSYGLPRASRAFHPLLGSSSDRNNEERNVKAHPSLGPFLAAGALSISFAASSYTVAAAKELPRADLIPKEVILYQYEACPFCNKVRAFLDYHNIPYRVVEVNPMSKKELKWSEYKKVPVLMVDGQQMNDSTAIISTLNERINPGEATSSAEQLEEQETWRRWVDEHLVHVLSPNIYRSPSEALESFEYITTHGNFTTMERLMAKYAGATAMYFISKRLKKRYNIVDERAALYDAAEHWVQALKDRSFMGGSKPNLADLAVFGVLRPLRHLMAGKEMVENTNIGPWYARMEAAVGDSSRLSEEK
ncbi:hypothetical protein GOP47_0000073 [Adiantum capillus-veneris]|uniref:Prostaglandin E synthase 2 n=1 Tax=Adiantum capillus-veneris TaxID=13818 RepID=A0A9D4ZQ80_ADICA|nr:hypothetical protein GOP47_0000073 [Adiantum capillus-veneris]